MRQSVTAIACVVFFWAFAISAQPVPLAIVLTAAYALGLASGAVFVR